MAAFFEIGPFPSGLVLGYGIGLTAFYCGFLASIKKRIEFIGTEYLPAMVPAQVVSYRVHVATFPRLVLYAISALSICKALFDTFFS